MASSEIVVPGQRLGSSDEVQPGPGTYERHGTIHAARLGRRIVMTHSDDKVCGHGILMIYLIFICIVNFIINSPNKLFKDRFCCVHFYLLIGMLI